jgi:uncharacterized membrane protein
MPPWNHLHPAVVHFPIASLTIAPLLVLLGLVWPAQRKGIHAAALLLLLLGSAAALLALATGQAAEIFARRTPELRAAVGRHEDLAQTAAALFGILTLAFGVLWGLPLLRKRPLPGKVETVLTVIWLAVALAGVITLGRAGHEGGHMVHDLHTHGGP